MQMFSSIENSFRVTFSFHQFCHLELSLSLSLTLFSHFLVLFCHLSISSLSIMSFQSSVSQPFFGSRNPYLMIKIFAGALGQLLGLKIKELATTLAPTNDTLVCRCTQVGNHCSSHAHVSSLSMFSFLPPSVKNISGSVFPAGLGVSYRVYC